MAKGREKNNGVGFYNNKEIIKQALKSGYLIVFKCKKKNIGLAVWHSDDQIKVDIDIFVIHPSYRKQGFGRLYYNEVLCFFRTKGFKIIQLFCEPSMSEHFWKKMNMIKLPKCGRTQHELTYYTILVNMASTEYISMKDKIELWDVEPFEAEEKEPKWTWYVEIKDGALLYPIIQPCNCNWNLRWSRNNQVIREAKVKYFTNKEFKLYFYPFLYIDELKE